MYSFWKIANQVKHFCSICDSVTQQSLHHFQVVSFLRFSSQNKLESAQSLSLKTRLGYWQINRLWVLPKNCFKLVPCYKISFRKGCTFAQFQVSIGLVALSFFFLTPTIYFVEVILQLIPVKSLLGSETIVNSVAYPVQPFASGDCSSILIWV